MLERVNGGAFADQVLTGSLRHFKITTADFSGAVDVNGAPVVNSAAEIVANAIAERATIGIMNPITNTDGMSVGLESGSANWTATELQAVLRALGTAGIDAVDLSAVDVEEVPYDLLGATGGGAGVLSVFGRTGHVTAHADDYKAQQISFAPLGDLTATNVRAAIEELMDITAKSGDPVTTNVVLQAEETSDQYISGTGIANQIQIKFGPAQSPNLLANGTYVESEAAYRSFVIEFSLQRSENKGRAEVWVYATLNDVQVGVSEFFLVDHRDQRINFVVTLPIDTNVGDEIKLFMYSENEDDVYLAHRANTAGLSDAPSASMLVLSSKTI